jgi:hypothetical protein
MADHIGGKQTHNLHQSQDRSWLYIFAKAMLAEKLRNRYSQFECNPALMLSVDAVM